MNGVKGQADGVLGLLKGESEPLELRTRAGSVVPNLKLGGLHVKEYRDYSFVGLHEKRQLMKTKIRIAVTRAEYRHTDLTADNGRVDVVEEGIPWFHAHAIQERWHPHPL